MTNAVKHAAPSEIRIQLSLGPRRYRLRVADDGAGFDIPDDVRKLGQDGHFGLLGMRERAEAVGASLRVESGQGRGTTVQVEGSVAGATAGEGANTPPPELAGRWG